MKERTIIRLYHLGYIIGRKFLVESKNHRSGRCRVDHLSFRRPWCPVTSQKSKLSFFQGPLGKGCHGSGSQEGLGVATWQGTQHFTMESTRLSVLGKHTFKHNRLLVFTSPWWPLWANSIARFLSASGITVRLPRSARLPSTEVSSLSTLANILGCLGWLLLLVSGYSTG